MEYNNDKIKYEVAQKYHIPESQIDDSLIPLFKMIDTVLTEQRSVNIKYKIALFVMVLQCASLLLGLWLYFAK
jgi:hypothetical protein